MPAGFHLVSSPFLFAQNVVVTAGLACALRRVADNGTACAVACAAILTKEVAEIFVEAGTGAASDGAAETPEPRPPSRDARRPPELPPPPTAADLAIDRARRAQRDELRWVTDLSLIHI